VYAFDKFWGTVSITVDGIRIVNQRLLVSFSLVKSYEFTVGVQEPHAVQIDKHRELAFGFARPQPIFAYVDGQLVAHGVA
jgi:hypothetical protein